MQEKKEHPQAKWLRAIADGETIQWKCHEGYWLDQVSENLFGYLSHLRQESMTLRIKPRTITIGKYEVVEPMKVAPAKWSNYWFVTPSQNNWVGDDIWDNHPTDDKRLESGMCWLKREDAELAAKAISELLLG